LRSDEVIPIWQTIDTGVLVGGVKRHLDAWDGGEGRQQDAGAHDEVEELNAAPHVCGHQPVVLAPNPGPVLQTVGLAIVGLAEVRLAKVFVHIKVDSVTHKVMEPKIPWLPLRVNVMLEPDVLRFQTRCEKRRNT
jgi:hypothetical protein